MPFRVFNKIKDGSTAVTNIVKDGSTAVTNKVKGTTDTMSLKKQLKDKVAEKSKMYSFIGMEVYDLVKQGKLDLAEISTFCEKLDELEADQLFLQAEIDRIEIGINNVKCACGKILDKDTKFCPDCGSPLPDPETAPICDCGTEFPEGIKFCGNCGTSLDSILERKQVALVEEIETTEIEIVYVDCICGAEVDSTLPMCMECGRKIESGV